VEGYFLKPFFWRAQAMSDVRAALELLDKVIAAASPERLPQICAALAARVVQASTRLFSDSSKASSNNTGDHDENLDVNEAARRLGVSKSWLYHKADSLPFTLRIGRSLRFSAKGLERWNRNRMGS
jgi:predicted DNA-binding transcriptional regulator AlpA